MLLKSSKGESKFTVLCTTFIITVSLSSVYKVNHPLIPISVLSYMVQNTIVGLTYIANTRCQK